jgi:hypothetical protein
MEVSDENGAHRDNSLLAADSSDNSWKRRKAGEFGSDGRLLPNVPAGLSVAAQCSTVGF